MNNKNLNLIKKIQKDLSFKLDLIDLEIKVENIEKYNVPYKVDTTRERDCLKC